MFTRVCNLRICNIVALGISAILGCSAADPTTAPNPRIDCVPHSTQACLDASLCVGIEYCSDSGSSWGPCICGKQDPARASGSIGRSSGSGGASAGPATGTDNQPQGGARAEGAASSWGDNAKQPLTTISYAGGTEGVGAVAGSLIWGGIGANATAAGGAAGGGQTGKGGQPAGVGVLGGTAGQEPFAQAGAAGHADLVVAETRGKKDDPNNAIIELWIRLTFTGIANLTEYSMRYWFTSDRNPFVWKMGLFEARNDANEIIDTVAFYQSQGTANGHDYVDLTLTSFLGQVSKYSVTIQSSIQSTVKPGLFNELNDWSYLSNATPEKFVPYDHIVVYRKGQVVWGREPPPLAQ